MTMRILKNYRWRTAFFFFFQPGQDRFLIFFLGKLKNRNVPFFMVLKLLKTGQFRQNRDGWQVCIMFCCFYASLYFVHLSEFTVKGSGG